MSISPINALIWFTDLAIFIYARIHTDLDFLRYFIVEFYVLVCFLEFFDTWMLCLDENQEYDWNTDIHTEG